MVMAWCWFIFQMAVIYMVAHLQQNNSIAALKAGSQYDDSPLFHSKISSLVVVTSYCEL